MISQLRPCYRRPSESQRFRYFTINDHEDRISFLPDCIIHCIFKFMEAREVVQTSLLSKRWRFTWSSNPYLTMTYSYFEEAKAKEGDSDNDELDDYYLEKFQDFVDHLLLNRDPTSQVDTFSLDFLDYHPSQTQSWLSYLYERNIQCVQLVGLHAPEEVLAALFGKVKSLALAGVEFVGHRERAELFLDCPILETLVLENCSYLISKGKNKGYQMDTYFDVKICAPKLKLLNIWRSYFSKIYNLENLSSLGTAMIEIDHFGEASNADKQCLNNILSGLIHAESLTYSAKTLKVCSEYPNTLKTVVTFQNLRYLKLKWWKTSRSYTISVMQLLEKCPNVETLVLVGNSSQKPKLKEEDLGAYFSSWCKLYHLKTIEITFCTIFEIDFKFLTFLMKSATSLQTLVLTTRETISTGKEKLVNFCKKLKVVPKVHLLRESELQLKLKISSSSGTVQWTST